MEGSIIPQINDFKSVVDFDDFVDFLYSGKFINEQNYYEVYSRRENDRIAALFSIIHSKENLEDILKYLKDTYPNHEKEVREQRDFRISSVRGDFPELPPNYVSRTSLVENVKFKLIDLKYNQKLVIHGMMGYGKSCLINDVLRDNKVRQYFDNYLFWINLGDCHSKEDVWQPMLRLYNTACSVLEKKTSHCPDDVEALKDSLIKLFLENRLKNSLIILDDIGDSDVLTVFDLKCKTVITTQNKNIFYNKSGTIFVEVKTGFSATESLELFKKSLKISNDLPSAAEEIHNICQGHPLLISLIGSYLTENAQGIKGGQEEIWPYMKNLFSEGNYRLNEYNPGAVDVNIIVKKCVEKLLTNDNLRDLYQDLVIFQQDVNIPPEVLRILWNKKSNEVTNIMNILAEKSLIVPFFHNDLKSYIYGIHQIFLAYLKEVTAKSRKDLHRKLLAGYDRITKQNYASLPNDNYTFQFIGYHLYHAEAFEKFEIYFDLKFLESKLKAVGKEDLLRDMNKYEDYITRKVTTLIEKLNQYKDFIQRCGANLYTYDKSDIVQYALRENKDTYVFKDALKIAKVSPHLYFQLQRPCEGLDYSQIINIRDDITSACFVDSPYHILIGTIQGKITLFYEASTKEISNFVGHAGAIKNLIVSPDKTHFLSVSIDGTVLLWKFAADSSRNSRDFTYEFSISPKVKQTYWQDMYTADRGQTLPRKRFKINEKDDFLISAAFCDNFPYTFRIVTGSEKGNVIIWDALSETQLYTTGRRGFSAPCLLYMDDEGEETVIFGGQESIFKYKVINDQLQYISQLHNTENCNALFRNTLHDSYGTLLAVGDRNITHWEKNKKTVMFENKTEEKKNICSTLTNDNKYLVVSTNQKTVYIWDIEEEKILREFENKGLAKSLDTFYDENKSVHILLIGSDKKTLQQCNIQPHEIEPQVEKIPVFTPFWKRKNPLTALVSDDNKLQVFSGYILISESEAMLSDITCTCFSLCGSIVIYGTKNGHVCTYDLRFKMKNTLQRPTGHPVTFLKCLDPSKGYQSRMPSISSGSSSDSLDILESNIGVVLAVFENDTVAIYNDKNVFSKEIPKPVIFCCYKQFLVIDANCKISTWNVETGEFLSVQNQDILEPVTLGAADYCHHKSMIGVFYKQSTSNFLDVYRLNKDYVLEKMKRIVMFNEKVNVLKFSCDGAMLALGMNTGAIEIYDLNNDYKHISLDLHDDPIQHLIFAPHKEPILLSVGEELAWWTLKAFQKPAKRKGRPNGIDILENLTTDLNSVNISYWADRMPINGGDYLLSFIKLKDKAKYMSASNDFNSFLCVDSNGKVYIMDIIVPV